MNIGKRKGEGEKRRRKERRIVKEEE